VPELTKYLKRSRKPQNSSVKRCSLFFDYAGLKMATVKSMHLCPTYMTKKSTVLLFRYLCPVHTADDDAMKLSSFVAWASLAWIGHYKLNNDKLNISSWAMETTACERRLMCNTWRRQWLKNQAIAYARLLQPITIQTWLSRTNSFCMFDFHTFTDSVEADILLTGPTVNLL